jgi:outer membrane protein assembly factor BamB
MSRATCRLSLAILFGIVLPTAAWSEDWPGWRGPRGDGTSPDANPPVEWSTTQNIRWKTPLPAPGNSTPIVLGQRIYITQATEKGAQRSVMCFDRASGKELWSKSISYADKEPTHEGNPYCSASPVTDGQAVYAWHGSAGVVAYDLEGKELWHADLGKFTHIWGNAGSPVVHGELVILHCGPGERAFTIALDKRSGKKVWEVPGVSGKADAFLGAWSSPRLVKHDGQDLLLLSNPKSLLALEPQTGKQLWQCDGLTDLAYTTPIVDDGVAVAMSGYHGRALAVRMGGEGNITDKQRLWVTPEGKKEQQRIGSGIIQNGRIIMVNEPGLLEVIDVATGEVQQKERLCGTTWSSLTHAGGKFYIFDQKGTTHVFTVDPKLKVLARNELGEQCNASHAFSDGQIFIRTWNHLWCVASR